LAVKFAVAVVDFQVKKPDPTGLENSKGGKSHLPTLPFQDILADLATMSSCHCIFLIPASFFVVL
jgi:hypothetical protein